MADCCNVAPEHKLSGFEKYLFAWVALCMVIGIVLSITIPALSEAINAWSIGNVSVPIGICLFFMMYPALLNLQVSELKKVVKHPKPILITMLSNWLYAPFLHWLFAVWLIPDSIENKDLLVVAIVLLGASPCTAMVLVWGNLAGGNQEQNFINTSLNTVTIVFLYAPVVALYTGFTNVPLDWIELFVSVLVFIGLPLIIGVVSKRILLNSKGEEWFENKYKPVVGKVAIGALLMTLIVLFSLNGATMVKNPEELFWVSVPLLILYPVVVLINLVVVKLVKLKYREASITVIIGSSSHFEIAIATAVALFGVGSIVALGTTMGLFWEVPIMLSLVFLLRKLRDKNFFGGEPTEKAL
jgi:ACR3 family arsenite transporter